MLLRPKHHCDPREAGFALGEVLIAFAILSLVFAGLIYGYVQANRMAEWSSMSLAAQSFASQGAEQARAADWNPRSYPVVDQLPSPTNYNMPPDYMDVPIKGSPTNSDFSFWVTNTVTISDYSTNNNPKIRQIRCDCHWTFPLTGQLQTNTVILLRATDQ